MHQITWLIRSDCFCSLVMTLCCHFLSWIRWYFFAILWTLLEAFFFKEFHAFCSFAIIFNDRSRYMKMRNKIFCIYLSPLHLYFFSSWVSVTLANLSANASTSLWYIEKSNNKIRNIIAFTIFHYFFLESKMQLFQEQNDTFSINMITSTIVI